MIELKNYHSPWSKEIQQTWQGDQYTLTKIVAIAYKIIVENAGVFLYNSWATANNFFNKADKTANIEKERVKHESEKKASSETRQQNQQTGTSIDTPRAAGASLEPTNKARLLQTFTSGVEKVKQTAVENKIVIGKSMALAAAALTLWYLGPNLLSTAGIQEESFLNSDSCSATAESLTRWLGKVPIGGTVAAVAGALAPEKTALAIVAANIFSMAEAILLRGVGCGENVLTLGGKFASCGKYASLVPVNRPKQLELKTFALLSATLPWLFNLGVAKRQNQSIRDQFNKKNLLYYAPLIGLSLMNPIIGAHFELTSRNGFDSSGHIMMKMAVGPAFAAAIAKTAQFSPILGSIFSGAYIFSDAVFVKNTALYCHTGLELGAGLAWGSAILGISSIVSRIF